VSSVARALATSPAPDFEEPFEDEREIIGDDGLAARVSEDEEDGEELFGENMER